VVKIIADEHKSTNLNQRPREERLRERSGFNTRREVELYEWANAQQPVEVYNIKDLPKED
jgi:hypothetical protein